MGIKLCCIVLCSLHKISKVQSWVQWRYYIILYYILLYYILFYFILLYFRIFPVARIFFTSSGSKSLLYRILFQEQKWQLHSRNITQSSYKRSQSTEAEKRIANVTFTVWHPVRQPCWVRNEGNWQYNRSLAVDTGRSAEHSDGKIDSLRGM